MSDYISISFTYNHEIILPVEDAFILLKAYSKAKLFTWDYNTNSAVIKSLDKLAELKYIPEQHYNEYLLRSELKD